MPHQPPQPTPLNNLQRGGQRCLLLGINGAGMTAAAEILIDAGHTVFGMDAVNSSAPDRTSGGRVDSVRRPRVAVEFSATASEGHRTNPVSMLNWNPDAIPANLDFCVSTRAVASDHPLMQALAERCVPVLSLPSFLAEIFAGHRQLCVAGTHGKSTTSAMLARILDQAGRSPSCFVGAHQVNANCSGRYRNPAASKDTLVRWPCEAVEFLATASEGYRTNCEAVAPFAVLESCEFSRSFLEFSPSVAVITGIERDHFDCFPDAASEDRAFESFVARLNKGGTLVHRADCPRSVAVSQYFGGRTISFRVCESNDGTDADWIALNTVTSGLSSRCRLLHKGRNYDLRLSIPGSHNIQNAVAAIAAAAAVGVDPEVACQALAGFQGIRRRFELRGHYAGITLIDDYAHHPTAIRETLNSIRQAFPKRRVIAAFEPHQIGRTEALFEEFLKSLALADEILILPVFPAREQVSHLECCRASGRLVKELNCRGSKALLFPNLDQIASRIDHSGRPSDIFVTMGAGRTNLIHDELTRRLQRNSVA